MSYNTHDDSLAERQQRAIERILEDEGLTSDLSDDQARPLIAWARYQASLVAADPAYSDEEVTAALRAIRKAVIHVPSRAPNEHDPTRLVALAQQLLNEYG